MPDGLNQIYIVIKGGCMQYVSTDSQEVIDNVAINLIDLDTQENYSDLELTTADTLTRIW